MSYPKQINEERGEKHKKRNKKQKRKKKKCEEEEESHIRACWEKEPEGAKKLPPSRGQTVILTYALGDH